METQHFDICLFLKNKTSQFTYSPIIIVYFLQAPDFYLYALYNKNKPMSDQLMSEHGTKFFRVSTILGIYHYIDVRSIMCRSYMDHTWYACC